VGLQQLQHPLALSDMRLQPSGTANTANTAAAAAAAVGAAAPVALQSPPGATTLSSCLVLRAAAGISRAPLPPLLLLELP
jgi:hypothetical protein